MTKTKLFVLIIAASVFAPAVAFANTYPEIDVRVQTASNSDEPNVTATVTVIAPGASLGTMPSGGNVVTYSTDFDNDRRTVTVLPGYYSVSLSPITNYAYSYSSGCSGTLVEAQERTCTITATELGAAAYPLSNQYYQSGGMPLSCAPAYQQAGLGASVTLTATGGTGSYSWASASQSYPGVGAALTVQLTRPGPHTFVVASGGRTAACSVQAVAAAYPGQYPHLPSTGFAPLSGLQLVLAAALLVLAALLSYPYVRNALTHIRR